MPKKYTIYTMKDQKRCPDGFMKQAAGPAIDQAIKDGKITKNDTFDCDESKLVARLKSKGV